MQARAAYCPSEIKPLAAPQAALFGFCLALVAYKVLAVVGAALCRAQGARMGAREVSLYSGANESATTYTGMMSAILEPEWSLFSPMSVGVIGASWEENRHKTATGPQSFSPVLRLEYLIFLSTITLLII